MSIRILLFLLLCTPAFAQKEYNVWYFGDHAGLDFNSGSPVVLDNSAMYAIEGCASISDSNGRILLYSNGQIVWNRDHTIMPNGTGLYGYESSSQGVLILPWPGKKDFYYIFTIDQAENSGGRGLRCSIVDMNLDNMKGDITTKNIPLVAPAAEKLTAVRHGNNQDMWVIVETFNREYFYAYRLTPTGIDPPVISPGGGTVPAEDLTVPGYMRVSPNGQKLALALSPGGLEMFDFNPFTGRISNQLVFSREKFKHAYGIEFSPNGQLLYASVTTSLSQQKVYQLNLMAGSVDDIITSSVPLCQGSAALQRGPDGKIYIVSDLTEFLTVIHNPNAIGTACDCRINDVDLRDIIRQTTFGLPNIPSEPVFTKTKNISATQLCLGDSTLLSLTDTAGVRAVHWNFGDPASNSENTSTKFNAHHLFTAPGTYFVSVVVSSDVQTDTLQSTFSISLPPHVSLGNDTILCHQTSYEIHTVSSEPLSYLWSTGESTASITVSTSGKYWVQAFNGTCFSTATIQITFSNPLLEVSKDQNICAGRSVQLSASGATSYAWTPVDGLDNSTSPAPIASPNVTTTYTVTGTDNNGCSTNAQVTVIVHPLPSLTIDGNQTICADGNTRLSVSGAKTYQWSPAEGLDDPTSPTPLASPKHTTTYTVTGTGEHECTDIQRVTVVVIEPDYGKFIAGHVTGDPGARVSLPISIRTQHPLPDTLHALQFQLHVDAFAFNPTGCSPGVFSPAIAAQQVIMNIYLDNVILTQSEQVLTEVQGIILVADSANVRIKLGKAQIQDCPQQQLQDGLLQLTGCFARARVRGNAKYMSITPNPAAIEMEIHCSGGETGRQQVSLYTLEGKNVWQQSFEHESETLLHCDVSNLAGGLYEIVWTTPSGAQAQQVHIQH